MTFEGFDHEIPDWSSFFSSYGKSAHGWVLQGLHWSAHLGIWDISSQGSHYLTFDFDGVWYLKWKVLMYWSISKKDYGVPLGPCMLFKDIPDPLPELLQCSHTKPSSHSEQCSSCLAQPACPTLPCEIPAPNSIFPNVKLKDHGKKYGFELLISK